MYTNRYTLGLFGANDAIICIFVAILHIIMFIGPTSVGLASCVLWLSEEIEAYSLT